MATSTAALVLLLALVLGPAPGLAARRDPPAPMASAAVRPVPGPVTRPFDPPPHPYGPGHRGVDLAADPGDPVRAALPGTVTFAGPVAGTAWVTVDHGGGLRTTYGDLVPARAAGDAVAAGGVVGHLVEGAHHLDWGARLDDAYLDPLDLLVRWRSHLTVPG
jgi:murein DD-endopeptidase MepM/ murein hydrolase activator NlpD